MREPLSNVERFSCVLETGSTYFIANITEKKGTTLMKRKKIAVGIRIQKYTVYLIYSLLCFTEFNQRRYIKEFPNGHASLASFGFIYIPQKVSN